MEIKYINPFIAGFLNVAGQCGIPSLQRTGLSKREKLRTDHDVNIIIGLTGEIGGNVVLSMHEATAKKIASAMMGGMEVPEFDMMPKSALCELANMSAGNSLTALAEMNVNVDITPPTLINGQNMVCMISQVETIVLEFTGEVGTLEINVALEM